MADNAPRDQNQKNFDRWYEPPAADFGDPLQEDPVEMMARERRHIHRYQFGFAVMGIGLLLASVFNVGVLLAFFFGLRPVVIAFQAWDFHQETAVVLSTVVGAGLLWGSWPDESWRRRSGLLLMMCLSDLILWSAEHATRIGLSDVAVGHDYFRTAIGHALGWCEFALIASLAAGMAARLGEPKALDLGRAVRSLTTVGASVWFAYFFFRTDWRPPIWPLRERPLNPELFMLWLGSAFLSAFVLVQVTLLTLFAGRTCALTARALRADDEAHESFQSRSEHGWNEFHNDRDRHAS